jgi:hypothetical protein
MQSSRTTRRVRWSGLARGRTRQPSTHFAELGAERCGQLSNITLDMSQAYVRSVREHASNATIVFDRFHVQRLAHDALDEVRRALVAEHTDIEERRVLKKTRFVLQKNPEYLSSAERRKLAEVQVYNRPLYRAYLLKESLASILDRRQYYVARDQLHGWLAWAARSRLSPFVRVARTVRKHLDGILTYLHTGLSNGRSEGLNGKVRVITPRSYGLHSARGLISPIFLCCSNQRSLRSASSRKHTHSQLRRALCLHIQGPPVIRSSPRKFHVVAVSIKVSDNCGGAEWTRALDGGFGTNALPLTVRGARHGVPPAPRLCGMGRRDGRLTQHGPLPRHSHV